MRGGPQLISALALYTVESALNPGETMDIIDAVLKVDPFPAYCFTHSADSHWIEMRDLVVRRYYGGQVSAVGPDAGQTFKCPIETRASTRTLTCIDCRHCLTVTYRAWRGRRRIVLVLNSLDACQADETCSTRRPADRPDNTPVPRKNRDPS